MRYSNTMEVYSVKVKKKKITEATIVLCGYVGIHTCSDAREKKDLKVAFPVRFLWPAQFGKLREILNK